MSAASPTRRDLIATSAISGPSVCFPNISLWRLKATRPWEEPEVFSAELRAAFTSLFKST
jgi:hypothetical protein